MKHQSAIVLATVLIASSWAMAQTVNVPGPGAHVSYVEGTVLVRHTRAGRWMPATTGTAIVRADRIATKSRARVEIRLGSGRVLRLDEDSRARITEIRADNIGVQLKWGLANYEVTDSDATAAEIETPNVSVHPLRAGAYRIEVDSDSETELTVREGEAEATTSDGSVQVNEGQVITVHGIDNPLYKTASAASSDEWDRWNEDRDRLISAELASESTVAKKSSGNPGASGTPAGGSAAEEARTEQPVPPALTITTGTVVSVRLNDELSSDRNYPGDSFSAVLQQPVVVKGWVVARRGQTVIGRVVVAKKASRVKGSSELGIELADMTLVDGKQIHVTTQLVQTSPPPKSRGAEVGTVATTTGLGTLVGAVAGGGTGAGIGAGVGAMAGMIGVLATSGRPTVLPPETLVTFRMQAPVEVSTAESRVAFRPITQEDYEGNAPGSLSRRPTLSSPAYPPFPYPIAPDWYGAGYPIYIGVSRVSVRGMEGGRPRR